MLNSIQQNKLMTEFTTPDEYFAGKAYECKSKSTMVDHHHASFWSPTQSGWGKAIKTILHFLARPIIWPGAQIFIKKKSTILGHLQQLRKGLRSTQKKVSQSEPYPEHNQFPPSRKSEDTNLVFLKTLDLTGIFYTDQTGSSQLHPARATYILW